MGSLADSIYEDEREAAARSTAAYRLTEPYRQFVRRKEDCVGFLQVLRQMPSANFTINDVIFLLDCYKGCGVTEESEQRFYTEVRWERLRDLCRKGGNNVVVG